MKTTNLVNLDGFALRCSHELYVKRLDQINKIQVQINLFKTVSKVKRTKTKTKGVQNGQ